MKAITIWQPWASYIAAGFKRFETRSWSTQYRGNIAIHAGKKRTPELEYSMSNLIKRYPGLAIVQYDELPFGCVIAACRLVACRKVEHVRDGVSKLELTLGDYTDGRYAWELEIIKLPDAPIPAKGGQGLWEWHHDGH